MTLQRRHLPDMRLLQTFEAAARHGNFTRAGEELALTQSAVSRQVRELEDQIGKPLFERVRARVVLTRAAEALLPEVQRLMRMAETTMRHASAGAQSEGVLAVNAIPTFAERWLMPRLPAFQARDPGLRFDISTRPGVFDFAETQCDIAIHYGQPIWPGAQCTYLCSEIVVPVAGGALRGRAMDAARLAEAPKLHLSARPTLWPDWFARLGQPLPEGRAGHWVDQFSLAIEAVKGGMGYALLPLYLIEGEIASGALEVVMDVPHSTDMAYYLAIPEGREDKVAGFRDWLISQVSFRPRAAG
ncbi:LysR family transcriptional regulator [Pseudooceanicola sp. CBS1P-1]|uniref:LysR family transcriptional regulator n=1 Tax=Pseudooceanicola albus TaxID=2692189 RepID=A0A6L7G6F9_9RHOB|nr:MULTISPECIES: LysR family transcriptional regulator [Pseudooceanicola]MBT9384378.1 LysR family transcriptional regulator [Pseudooceanicola endophyticus]MXN19884.1 LysR family transcriptional regulator [Pseudooceanicola albus]